LKQVQVAWLMAGLLLLLPCSRARAQSTTTQFLPEVDAYIRLASNIRLQLQGKVAIQDGDFFGATLGPSLEFNLKPLRKLKDIAIFDLDDMKCMPVTLSIGYRYLPSGIGPPTNRFEPILTLHIPAPRRLLITDRNRADLDWSNGSFKWRYRNRITIERRVTIRSYHPAPYGSVEFLYESPYSKWASTRLYAGCLLPLTKRLQLDPYYEHVNNTGKHPNQQVNAAGLALSLYFPPYKP
jgi:hypothetical protein